MSIEYIALILSLAFNGAMAFIAVMAENRVRKIDREIRLYRDREMYADIVYGTGGKSQNPPWNTDKPDEEYDRWFTRFCSYNGRVGAEIQEDFAFVVDNYLHRPNDNMIEMNELPRRRKRIDEYSKLKVIEIGNKLRDA